MRLMGFVGNFPVGILWLRSASVNTLKKVKMAGSRRLLEEAPAGKTPRVKPG